MIPHILYGYYNILESNLDKNLVLLLTDNEAFVINLTSTKLKNDFVETIM